MVTAAVAAKVMVMLHYGMLRYGMLCCGVVWHPPPVLNRTESEPRRATSHPPPGAARAALLGGLVEAAGLVLVLADTALGGAEVRRHPLQLRAAFLLQLFELLRPPRIKPEP